MHWVLSPEPANTPCPVPVVEDLLLSNGYLQADARLTWLRSALHVSSETIASVADLTTGQRKNPLWSMVRKLRLTASNFGITLGAISRNRYM